MSDLLHPGRRKVAGAVIRRLRKRVRRFFCIHPFEVGMSIRTDEDMTLQAWRCSRCGRIELDYSGDLQPANDN